VHIHTQAHTHAHTHTRSALWSESSSTHGYTRQPASYPALRRQTITRCSGHLEGPDVRLHDQAHVARLGLVPRVVLVSPSVDSHKHKSRHPSHTTQPHRLSPKALWRVRVGGARVGMAVRAAVVVSPHAHAPELLARPQHQPHGALGPHVQLAEGRQRLWPRCIHTPHHTKVYTTALKPREALQRGA
jgi:hypothetical protein